MARSADGDGEIKSISELFGTSDASGFSVLSELDSVAEGGNEDGIITVGDAAFADLLLWVDANKNATTDSGELQTLAEHGIVELSLAVEDPANTVQILGETAGNEITGGSTFKRETLATPTSGDGSVTFSTGLLADVSFVYESTGIKIGGGGGGDGDGDDSQDPDGENQGFEFGGLKFYPLNGGGADGGMGAACGLYT